MEDWSRRGHAARLDGEPRESHNGTFDGHAILARPVWLRVAESNEGCNLDEEGHTIEVDVYTENRLEAPQRHDDYDDALHGT
jgi:hypothetical protein